MRTADAGRHFSGISNIVSETTLAVPDTLGPAAIDDLVASSTEETAITLQWTAPADDDGSPAFAYDIRYATDPIDVATFSLATPAPEVPAPATPGSPSSFRIANLDAEQTYFAIIRSEDAAGNLSELSNLATVTTPDLTTPSRVSDLAVRGTNETGILLTWTAPGDDGRFGTADRYDLRWDVEPLDDANFVFADAIEGLAPPAPGETFESRTVARSELPQAIVYLALRTFDNAGNVSDVSNTVQVDLSAR